MQFLWRSSSVPSLLWKKYYKTSLITTKLNWFWYKRLNFHVFSYAMHWSILAVFEKKYVFWLAELILYQSYASASGWPTLSINKDMFKKNEERILSTPKLILNKILDIYPRIKFYEQIKGCQLFFANKLHVCD